MTAAARLAPRGVCSIGPAAYAYGVCWDAASARVLYSSFADQTIMALNPVTGVQSTLLTGAGAIYTLTQEGSYIYYMTRSDAGLGEVRRVGLNGTGNTALVGGLTRGEDFDFRANGNLLVPNEAGDAIIEYAAGTWAPSYFLSGLSNPQSVWVLPNGDVAFSEYGNAAADGSWLTDGRIAVRRGAETLTAVSGVHRARAVMADGAGNLYWITEANRDDEANSGALWGLINGVARPLLRGLDYPAFADIAPDGTFWITSVRDDCIYGFNPRARVARVRQGTLDWLYNSCRPDPAGARRLKLTVAGASYETGLRLPVSGPWCVTLSIAAGDVAVSKDELRQQPGVWTVGRFPLPALTATMTLNGVNTGMALMTRALVERNRGGARWPMTNVGTANETNRPGFDEHPRRYLVSISGVV